MRLMNNEEKKRKLTNKNGGKRCGIISQLISLDELNYLI